jgi:hypothetical protein
MSIRLMLSIAAIMFLSLGCDSSDSDRDARIPISKAPPVGESSTNSGSKEPRTSGGERKFDGVRFQIPEGWEEGEGNQAISAEFFLPGAAGNARLTLSTAGGTTAMNMDRWRSQLKSGPGDPESKESTIRVADRESTMLEAYGAFSGMMSDRTPKPNWQLIGIAIPIGPEQHYFIKLTGPRETVQSQRDAFMKFVESAKLAD